jgi:DNA transposition AAA+ family ATPase
MVTTSETPAVQKNRTPSNAMRPNNSGFHVPADKVRVAIQDLPEDQRDLVWWFSQWCQRNNLGREALGKILRKPGGDFYSFDSIIQLLTGGRIRRGENIEPMLDAIDSLRRVEGEREIQTSSGFIETRLAREIWKRCRKALLRQRIMFIFGESQIGKTEALKRYARDHNHGETVYIEMPSGGSVSALIHALAKHFNIPSKSGAKADLRQRIIDCFDSRMLLIVDEGHRALKPGSTTGLDSFSFLREIWNKRNCGMVISLTNEGRDEMLHGPHAKVLAQIWKRRITPLQLPAVPPDDDAALFAAAYGLTPATDTPVTIEVTTYDGSGNPIPQRHKESPLALQRETLKTEGLGVWISILQDAADMAQEHGKRITWGAVIKASCQAKAEADIFI